MQRHNGERASHANGGFLQVRVPCETGAAEIVFYFQFRHVLYLIDLGLSRRFRQPDGTLRPPRKNWVRHFLRCTWHRELQVRRFSGRFMATRCHQQSTAYFELSPADDIVSALTASVLLMLFCVRL